MTLRPACLSYFAYITRRFSYTYNANVNRYCRVFFFSFFSRRSFRFFFFSFSRPPSFNSRNPSSLSLPGRMIIVVIIVRARQLKPPPERPLRNNIVLNLTGEKVFSSSYGLCTSPFGRTVVVYRRSLIGPEKLLVRRRRRQ